MIHFLTVHWRSPAWIDVQLREIARHMDGHSVRTWACLNEIDPAFAARFDRTFDLDGTHPEKLNELARSVSSEAADEDLLVFLDGDAFPITDFVADVEGRLSDTPLVAVRRSENLGDPQPHPCFAVTTVGFWREIGGDWTKGQRGWMTTPGVPFNDTGGRMLELLEERDIAWHPLLRTNRINLHPVLFAVYGGIAYHHGAAFRRAKTRWDRWKAGEIGKSGLRKTPLTSAITRYREFRNASQSRRIYERIVADPAFVARYFAEGGAW